jgi:hypothetical protein
LSHDAHEGRRWSHLFFLSLQRLQALTLRKELEVEGVIGDAAFTVDEEPEGEGLSPSREVSSKERLRPLIRAHGKKSAGFGASRALAAMASHSPTSLQTDELLPRTATTASATTTGERDGNVGCDCARRTSSCGVQMPLPQKATDSRRRSWMASMPPKTLSLEEIGYTDQAVTAHGRHVRGCYFTMGCVQHQYP